MPDTNHSRRLYRAPSHTTSFLLRVNKWPFPMRSSWRVRLRSNALVVFIVISFRMRSRSWWCSIGMTKRPDAWQLGQTGALQWWVHLMVRIQPFHGWYIGSTPVLTTNLRLKHVVQLVLYLCWYVSLAQMEEHTTFNRVVRSSNLRGHTISAGMAVIATWSVNSFESVCCAI